ncbi:MAG TPA: hypothetical protein VFM69_08020 [Pricia sp.]|nr:hypothetical protein [Pricia sp.]
MKNILTISMTHTDSRKKTKKSNKLGLVYRNMLAEFKSMQTGYATIGLIGQSCLGSIAAMTVLMNDITQVINLVLLALVTIFCMAFNGAVLAQLKTKTIFNLLLVSVAFSSAVIISYLI